MILRDEVTITSLNENSLLVSFGNVIDFAVNEKVISLARAITKQPFIGFLESVPCYSSLAIFYDVIKVRSFNNEYKSAYEFVSDYIQTLVKLPEDNTINKNQRLVEIPVLYDGEDLDYISTLHQKSRAETIRLHSSIVYSVFMIGFLPGFPYMGTVDQRIETPRKTAPRKQVPAGSVGIAGKQTGVYPQASPGGWQLIGRTPLKIFDTNRESPCLLQPGDTVKFVAIDEELFNSLNEY